MGQLSENWATLWESLAAAQPDHGAVVVGDQVIRWSALEERAARLASLFTGSGIGHDAKVAQLLYNCPEYLEAVFAAFKVRATPVNVNYRYLADEVAYVLDNSDTEAVVFHGSLGDRIAATRDRLPRLKLLLQVDDGSPLVEGAQWYHEAVAAADPAAPVERSGDDLLFLYTGGTTGLPKGVMWRHADLFGALAYTGYVTAGLEVPTTPAEVGAVAASLNAAGRSPVNLCAPPLMHGTALFLAIQAFVMGGRVVLLGGRRFDADELWRLVEQHGVTQLSIVGDAFARPMVAALDAARASGTPYCLDSLQRVVSTGATLSAELKRAFQAHAPQVMIIDMIGASEGGPFALSMTLPGQAPTDTAVFTAPPNAVVIDDTTGLPAERGSGVVGMLAVSGPMPSGYYGDPERTAATFRTIDGVRYTVPGDYATIDVDGTVHLLGRGSVCINTGGEKVYPEEVEVAARAHPGVLDCAVVGIADERFGEAVTLVAARRAGEPPVSDTELDAHLRSRVAPYKVPRHIVWVDTVERSPSGKSDYRWARRTAEAALAAGS
jgi:acyl-CoA synthetase (AMP-forming)/AMP-acid ligase II